MDPTILLVDLDDTLYPATSGLWALMRRRIEVYVSTRLHLSIPETRRMCDDLFRNYGTTLRGLQILYRVDEREYLKFVHDVPLWNFSEPDPHLKTLLESCPQRKVIFTNGDAQHARRVLRTLGLESCFDQIIDICVMAPYCKPMPEAFAILLNKIGEPPEACLLLDDSLANLLAARALGMQAIRVGPAAAGFQAISSLHHLPTVLSNKS